MLVLAMFIISKYELSDEVVDKINSEIERRSEADAALKNADSATNS